jgi:hypothetical protein
MAAKLCEIGCNLNCNQTCVDVGVYFIESVARLRARGIWLSAQVQSFALDEEAKLTR